jgi:hypothetical protein
MLKTVDVLIGVSAVMLITSMAVTVLTGFVVRLQNTRGRHLLNGLVALLQYLDPTLPHNIAEEIVTKVLTNPLISQGGNRLGSVIHRDELTVLLLHLASSESQQEMSEAAKSALLKILQANGISDPGATLKNVRELAMQLEMSHPDAASHVRKNMAILRGAGSDFVLKINAWFDQTIDRISDRFTASTRTITFVAALLITVVLQLDTVGLINRLSMDDGIRNSFIQQTILPEKNPNSGALPDRAYYEKYYRLLASDGLIAVPQSPGDWLNQWRWPKLPGILLSAILLSLGAPFWYNSLKGLLQLRSLAAGKDDHQREARQSPQDGDLTAGLSPAVQSISVAARAELASGAPEIPEAAPSTAGQQGHKGIV